MNRHQRRAAASARRQNKRLLHRKDAPPGLTGTGPGIHFDQHARTEPVRTDCFNEEAKTRVDIPVQAEDE